MSRRLLIILIVAAVVGGGAGLAIWFFNREHPQELSGLTEKDLAEGYRKMGVKSDQTAPEAPAPLPPNKTIRLAVGSLGQSEVEKDRQLADLLTANLTGAKGLDLVERRAFDKVLSEMSLNLSGVVRAKDAVRVGKLLGADWFLLASHSRVGASNAMVARIVDARTGILRDIDVATGPSNVTAVAAELSGFVRHARENASSPKPRTFLAIGQFADVGVNNKQAGFASELRAYLIGAYRNSAVTLLEREYVDALLQEVYLDMAGLTDAATNSVVQIQSAFWLVQGYYQSYESATNQVEVVLRTQRIFGRKTEKTLLGLPGDELFHEIKSSIDTTIASAGSTTLVSSRVSEVRAQFAAGKDLHGIATGDNSLIRPIGPGTYGLNFYNAQHPELRKRNLEEAIRCFQTVLLLEPDNLEAKYMVAVCLHDRAVGRFDQARGVLREIADSKDYKWSRKALLSLGSSYTKEDNREAARWYTIAAERSNNPADAQAAKALADSVMVDTLSAESRLTGVTPKSGDLDALLRDLTIQIRSHQDVLRNKSGGIRDDYGLDIYALAFGTNKQALAENIVQILPVLKTNFPDMVPHLLSAAVAYQIGTNNSVYREFLTSLAESRDHPDKLLAPDWYFRNVVTNTYNWAMANSNYTLGLDLIQAKRQAAKTLPNLQLTTQDKLRLGYAYAKLERWREALDVFEPLGEKPIDMGLDGIWGRAFVPVPPADLVDVCRSKLKLPPTPLAANRFRFGPPVLHIHSEAVFTTEPSGLWLCVGSQLLHLTYGLETNSTVSLPFEAGGSATQILAEGTNVWLATEGAGLFAYDKSNRKWNHFTEQDGLLMNQVLCLAPASGSVWLGFGANNSGGVASLDLASHRITAFTPRLNPATVTAGSSFFPPVDREADSQPPRYPVSNIALGPNHELLMYMKDSLRRYKLDQKAWDVAPIPGRPTCFSADSNHVALGLVRPGGAISVRGLDEKQWRSLEGDSDLPHIVQALALDGSDLWAGGDGFVAVFDLNEYKLRKLCYLASHRLRDHCLQIGGGFAWLLFEGHLYRVPLRDVK